MKLIKPSYEILTPIDGEQIIIDIEKVARTCYKSEDRVEIESNYLEKGKKEQYAKSGRKLVKHLIKKGHDAMIEFGHDITVKFIVDRGISHELVRQRMASFAQESSRYVNYTLEKHGNGSIQFIHPKGLTNEQIVRREAFYWEVQDLYELEISEGVSPQLARGILTNSVKTEINIKANLREWRHIFKLRTAKAAHPQMREVMCPLLDEFKERIPLIFDDIKY